MRKYWVGFLAIAQVYSQAFAQPEITENPQDRTAAAGAPVTFAVVAQGTSPLRYQWQFNGQDISRGQSRVLRFFATPTRAGTYSVRVRDASGNEKSSAPATLQVMPRPVILVQPKNQIVGEHGTAVFDVKVNDSGPYSTIQWFHHSPEEPHHAIPDGLNVRGLHTFHFEIPDCNNNGSYNGLYWVAVTNQVGGVISRRASLTVVGPPRLTMEPQDRTVRRGGSAMFSVGIAPDAGGPKTKQWYRNGEPIGGAVGRVFRIAHVQPDDAGYYYCVVSSRGGATQSYSAALTVLE